MKLLSFFLFGALSYSINIGLTFLFVKIVGISKPKAYIISLGIVLILSFCSSLLVTFKKKFSFSLLTRYTFSLLSFTLLNYFLVLYIDSILKGQGYYFVIFGITTVVFLIKYGVYNRFVFT